MMNTHIEEAMYFLYDVMVKSARYNMKEHNECYKWGWPNAQVRRHKLWLKLRVCVKLNSKQMKKFQKLVQFEELSLTKSTQSAASVEDSRQQWVLELQERHQYLEDVQELLVTLGGGNQATIYHLQAEIIQFLKLAVPAWKAITAIQPLKKLEIEHQELSYQKNEVQGRRIVERKLKTEQIRKTFMELEPKLLQDPPHKPSHFLSHVISSGGNNPAVRSYTHIDKACSLHNLKQQHHQHWKFSIYENDFYLPLAPCNASVPKEVVHVMVPKPLLVFFSRIMAMDSQELEMLKAFHKIPKCDLVATNSGKSIWRLAEFECVTKYSFESKDHNQGAAAIDSSWTMQFLLKRDIKVKLIVYLLCQKYDDEMIISCDESFARKSSETQVTKVSWDLAQSEKKGPELVQLMMKQKEKMLEHAPSTKEIEKQLDQPKKQMERPELMPSTNKMERPELVSPTKETERSELFPLIEEIILVPPTDSLDLESSTKQKGLTLAQPTKQVEIEEQQKQLRELELLMKGMEGSEEKLKQKLENHLQSLNQVMKEGLEKHPQEVKQKLEYLEQPLKKEDMKRWQAEFAQKLKHSAHSIMKIARSTERLKENLAKSEKVLSLEKFAQFAKNERVLKQMKGRNRLASIRKLSIPTNSQQVKVLQTMANFLSLYDHGNYPHTSGRASGLSSLPDKILSRKAVHTPSKNNWTVNTVQSTSTCDKRAHEHKLILINNNQSSAVCPAGESSYLHQDSESQLSDASSYYSARYDWFMNIDDLDIMSVGIDSDLQSIDRDVCVVRRKTMTDPSPAYRQQFYVKHTWRYEQNDSNTMNLCLPVSSQSSIEADESDNNINTCLPTKRTRKLKNRQSKAKDQIDDSSSNDSHWSIILKRDLKN